VAATRDSIADVWGERTRYHGEWPVRVDQRTTEEPDRWVQSACVLCSNGCGMDVGAKDGKIVGVRGRAVDRVNKGRLGLKGLHGWEANATADRLTTPLIRHRGKLTPATWDEAMGLIVERTRETRDKHTANAIGFYTSGQLFIEEYYTLAVLGKGGLGTPHMDGNTRLCTATAARTLIESFGSDGQPGSYTDIDHADAFLLAGHNMASQQTVLWGRVLDRLDGPDPPKLVVIDPRVTDSARRATVHLAPRVGTNVAVMNGLLHLVIASGHIDRGYIDRHTVGFEALRQTVAAYDPARVEEITGVPAATLRAAAEVLGATPRLTSTVLQGFYQSHQATAAGVQVNNLQLIRGMIGKPGRTVLQMNGQPTAQNTRETGCDGEMPGFRNWGNFDHIKDLAAVWNVDPSMIPHWAPPTHAMQIVRYAEEGSIKFLWVSATNPAVSMPDLPRVRRVLGQEDLFLVVQDAWRTETAELADVVLPAAIWAEKTGTFTNVDRTVHLSMKAVDPPGEARSDLDIFIDYARRMDFRDKDGAPLVKWSDPEGAFNAWRACSRGRTCDYTALSYAKLTGGSGVQWPCNDESPDGAERLYTDGKFNTDPDRCADYGHDLITGAAHQAEAYKANDPGGRAFLKPAEYTKPFEEPDADYPLWLTTGRVVYQFHTRTKTGRSPELNAAAPEPFAQMHPDDAARLGVAEGAMVVLESRRGRIRVPARIGDILPGHVFVSFHYGDSGADGDGARHAANDLTLPDWDPVSKQPVFKYSAVRAHKVGAADHAGVLLDAAVVLAGAAAGAVGKAVAAPVKAASPAPKSHLGDYLGLAVDGEKALADAFLAVGKRHAHQPDMISIMAQLASWSRAHVESLKPVLDRHPAGERHEPDRLAKALFQGGRAGGVGLLRDLHDLWILAHEVHVTWDVLKQTAAGLRDKQLAEVAAAAGNDNNRQIAWLRTRVAAAAPEALIVPS